MLVFSKEEMQMVGHAAEVMDDRISNEPDEYNDADATSTAKLDAMSRAKTVALVVTGAEMDSASARHLMGQIVNAEMDHWVPGASQRLLYRASRALGVSTASIHLYTEPDCGSKTAHALVTDWVADIYVVRCVVCGRLDRA